MSSSYIKITTDMASFMVVGNVQLSMDYNSGSIKLREDGIMIYFDTIKSIEVSMDIMFILQKEWAKRVPVDVHCPEYDEMMKAGTTAGLPGFTS